MRFYTKEWYLAMQKMDFSVYAKKIPDKDYSMQDVDKLYRAEEKIFCDENYPDSEEESKKTFYEEYLERLELLRNTNESDDVEYSVDIRLQALNLYPESIFNILKNESDENKKIYDSVVKSVAKYYDEHPDLNSIYNILSNHDEQIWSISREGEDIIVSLSNQGDKQGRIISFSGNAQISYDSGLENVMVMNDEINKDSDLIWLYAEVFREENYVVNILVSKELEQLFYISIKCDEIRENTYDLQKTEQRMVM